MTGKRKNATIRLIRKKARGFRVDEWLYLFGCPDPHDGALLQGSFLIREIKHHTDSTVTFRTNPIRHVDSGQGYEGLHIPLVRSPRGTYIASGYRMLEFSRDTELHRIAGLPLGYVITEDEFA